MLFRSASSNSSTCGISSLLAQPEVQNTISALQRLVSLSPETSAEDTNAILSQLTGDATSKAVLQQLIDYVASRPVAAAAPGPESSCLCSGSPSPARCCGDDCECDCAKALGDICQCIANSCKAECCPSSDSTGKNEAAEASSQPGCCAGGVGGCSCVRLLAELCRCAAECCSSGKCPAISRQEDTGLSQACQCPLLSLCQGANIQSPGCECVTSLIKSICDCMSSCCDPKRTAQQCACPLRATGCQRSSQAACCSPQSGCQCSIQVTCQCSLQLSCQCSIQSSCKCSIQSSCKCSAQRGGSCARNASSSCACASSGCCSSANDYSCTRSQSVCKCGPQAAAGGCSSSCC